MPGPLAARGAIRAARRMWPLVLEGYRRWDRLSPAEKDRYRQMARDYGRRGWEAVDRARSRGTGRRR
jgi:hypothetical protein